MKPKTKSIDTLISDIQSRLTSGEPFNKEVVQAFAENLAKKLSNRLAEARGRASLRLSNLGWPDRKLWYSVNQPEMAEPLPASTRFKFLFGDIIEEVVLFLARASGHRVENEQEEVEINGVVGHIDAVVDDELVDVKSASSYSFRKFQDHGLVHDDPFGYLPQLGSYHAAMSDRGGSINTDRAHFLAVDKTLGHLTLDTHDKTDVNYDEIVSQKREMLAAPEPPVRCYSDEPDGRSGNRKLGIACSYCPFKSHCWPELRAFAYSRGPVFLTEVVRTPDVPEIDLRKTDDNSL